MTARMCWQCSAPAVTASGYCDACSRTPRYEPKATNKKKGGKRKSPPVARHPLWRRLAAAFLRRNPHCARCAMTAGKQFVPATSVDHVLSVRLFPERELDEGNLQSLCHPCHSSKTGYERGGKYYDYLRGKLHLLEKS